jgi:hypothetical protein
LSQGKKNAVKKVNPQWRPLERIDELEEKKSTNKNEDKTKGVFFKEVGISEESNQSNKGSSLAYDVQKELD